MSEDAKVTIDKFNAAVNMTPRELERWLQTEESRAVGQKRNGGESVGHEMGRYIVELLRRKQAEYATEDLVQMRRVVGFVNRHTAQRPVGDIEHTRWRYSLMNWGHDPLK